MHYAKLLGLDMSKKGIAGRAIFVDWYSWALKQGREIDATSSYAVPFSEVIQALESQGLSRDYFRLGDILVIRFGYLAQYNSMSQAKRESLNEHYKTHKPDNIGIEPSREFLEFLWEKKIAAVAGDSRSFEVWPCQKLEWHLHEWLLAGWGMPIGELFDLEELSNICESLGRYQFFLSSAPMNVGIAVDLYMAILTFNPRHLGLLLVLQMCWRSFDPLTQRQFLDRTTVYDGSKEGLHLIPNRLLVLMNARSYLSIWFIFLSFFLSFSNSNLI